MKRFRNIVGQILIACIALTSFPAQAGMIGTDQVVASATAQADHAKVLDFLTRADVQREMQAFGITPEQAMTRVNALTDEEARHIAGQIASLPAGGADVYLYVVTIVVLIIAYVVYISYH